MVKNILPALAIVFFLSSCSTFKPLNFTNSKPVLTAEEPKQETRFLDEINVTPKATSTVVNSKPVVKEVATKKPVTVETVATKKETDIISRILASRKYDVEQANAVQLKYAVLLNTEIESLPATSLLESVDEWYGVQYRRGGNTKNGVDCSGFTVAVYETVYGMTIPRVSRDQYKISRKISSTELSEGDLVFFNTNGKGVSHVGVYLGNNKFIHASVSRGIMVSDLYDSYYMKRYLGAGRIDEKQEVASN